MIPLDVFLAICCAAILYLIGFLIAIERESRARIRRNRTVLELLPVRHLRPYLLRPAPLQMRVARTTMRAASSAGSLPPNLFFSELRKSSSQSSGIKEA